MIAIQLIPGQLPELIQDGIQISISSANCGVVAQDLVCSSANQFARSSAPAKSSRASTKDSSYARGRAWMRAVVAVLRGPQRRLSWRRVTGSSLCGATAGFALQTPLCQKLLGETGVAQMVCGQADQGHDFLASEMGKPLPQDRDNGVEQIGSGLKDLPSGAWNVGLGQHRQGEHADQRMEAALVAELL
jgi:hypothetical protein